MSTYSLEPWSNLVLSYEYKRKHNVKRDISYQFYKTCVLLKIKADSFLEIILHCYNVHTPVPNTSTLLSKINIGL